MVTSRVSLTMLRRTGRPSALPEGGSSAAAALPGLTNAERSTITRARLFDAAECHFGRVGYVDSTLEEIAVDAGATRGAIYHHFHDKRDLFEAVYARLHERVLAAARTAYRAETDPARRLEAAFQAYVGLLAAPEAQRIAVHDAAAVLGGHRHESSARRAALTLLQRALYGAAPKAHSEALLYVLAGALHEASVFVASSDDREGAAAEVGRVLSGLCRNLLEPGEPAGTDVRPLFAGLRLVDADSPRAPATRNRGPRARPRLTTREWEVVRLASAGHANAEIAAHLGITQRTAGTHMYHVLRKLDLRSRHQLPDWLAAQGERDEAGVPAAGGAGAARPALGW